MARSRNYAAEYEARQAKAQALGYESYWARRQVRRNAVRRLVDPDRLDRAYAAKPKGMGYRDYISLYNQGEQALKRQDHEAANRIARQLGVKSIRVTGRNGRQRWLPPERIFYYHR
jgi:hypothetical protein